MEGLLLLSGEDGIESVDWKENNTSRPAWNRKWKRLRDLWDSSTIWNICDHQSPKRKEKSKAEGTLEEIIAENVQGLWKANLQLREAKLTSNRINPKKSMLKHIIVKSLKTKDRGKSWNWLKMNSTLPTGNTDLNDNIFLTWNHKDQKEMANYFSSA